MRARDILTECWGRYIEVILAILFLMLYTTMMMILGIIVSMRRYK